MHPFIFGYDFYFLWSAGELLHQGRNPYDFGDFKQQLDALGWPPSEIPCRFPHPINTLWVYWVFALMPFNASLALWSILSMALIVVCSLSLAKALECQATVSSFLLMFSVILFPPTLGHLIWGQMNVLLLVGLTLFALGWRRGRFFGAGVGLSLTLLKLHIFIPLLLVVSLWELRQRRVALLVGGGVGLALQVAASYAIAPDCFTWYRGSFDGLMGESLRICGATVGQLLECGFDLHVARPTLLAAGSLAAVWFVGRQGYSLRTLLCVVLPLSVCVAPYCWMHAFVVLIPCFLRLLNRVGSQLPESGIRYVVMAMAALSIPIIVSGRYQAVWILFSWGLLAAGILLGSQGGSSLEDQERRTT